MPIYISRGHFTTDATKGMIAKAENREEAVSDLFENVGGRLIGWYLTFGPHDWLVIGEFPSDKAAASAILAAAGGSSLSNIETTVAMNAEDARATFEAAGTAARDCFRSAGRLVVCEDTEAILCFPLLAGKPGQGRLLAQGGQLVARTMSSLAHSGLEKTRPTLGGLDRT